MWRSLVGYYDIEITCGFASDILTRLNNSGIHIRHVRIVDALHICLEIDRFDMNAATVLIEKFGGKIKELKRRGIYWYFPQIFKRPVLLVGVAVIVFLSFHLSTRVLFVNVTGNENIAEKYILEKAEVCGIRFGSLRKDVRSEKVKNRLLEQLPQLRWAGVNTTGCVATIIVKEREMPESAGGERGVGKIVAERDGVIGKIVVKKGTALCSVGQAVKAGQTLVSGYTDTGLSIKAEMPIAEVLATTQRQLCVVTPTLNSMRNIEKDRRTFYHVRIGKKLIKFCKDSGILGAGCVKMYSEKNLVLPGGFVLPVALIKVDVIDYVIAEQQQENLESFQWLFTYGDKYVNDQMRFGKVLEKQEAIRVIDGCAVSTSRYLCTEMIGQVQNEEIITGNGKRQ